MQPSAGFPLACFLSIIRPPAIEFETGYLQLLPIDKLKCPYVKSNNDVGFRLYTKHNPTEYQELFIGDDSALQASNIDLNDPTVIFFHAFLENPDSGSALAVRQAYMLRKDSNVIMVNAQRLEAGPWYFTAAENTWYIGQFAARFVDYLVSRGLDLSRTHFIGHSLGAQAAGVAGSALQSGRVSRITGLDPAMPLFEKLPLSQKLDPSDAHFVDVIHTDAGIFGVNQPMGHVDFFPNGGISPQPGCELEIVVPKQLILEKFFCSHWRSYYFYAESVVNPDSFMAAECTSMEELLAGKCGSKITEKPLQGFYIFELEPNNKQAKRFKTDSKLDNYYGYTKRERDGKSIKNKEKKSVFEPTQIPVKHDSTGISNTDTDGTKFDAKLDLKTTQSTEKVNPELKHYDIPLPLSLENYEKNTHSKKDLSASDMEISYQYKTPVYAKHRQKRFTLFRRQNEGSEQDNFVLKMVEFLVKNRRNVIPVVSVMREINTLVKSANGELNHVLKERNNYIGTPPPLAAPVNFNLELGKDPPVKAFFKRMLGLGTPTEKLSISGAGGGAFNLGK